jgi:drug/metabolite transporter (DMT)-like permease
MTTTGQKVSDQTTGATVANEHAPTGPAGARALAEPRMAARDWAVLLVTAMLFGSSFFLIKIAVDTVPPATLAAGRAALAVPIAWAFLRMTGGRLPALGRDWIPLIVLGVLTAAVPYGAIAWGQRHIESSLAGMLFGMVPVFSVALAPIFLRDETLTPGRLSGAALGLGGVILLLGPQALAGLGNQVAGALVTLGAALSYALGGIYARRHRQVAPTVMAAGQLVTAAIILLPISLVLDAPWTLAPPAPALGAVAAVAVLSTALPALLLFWLIGRVGATNGALLAFFMPVVAVVLGVMLLGEQLPWTAVAGLGLILIGAAAVNGRLRLPAKATA